MSEKIESANKQIIVGRTTDGKYIVLESDDTGHLQIKVVNSSGDSINLATEDKQDDIITGIPIKTRDEVVGTQNPFSTDGDSVYPKDIDLDRSNIGTFTGNLEDIANGESAGFLDLSATNPKHYTIYFKRPLTTGEITVASQIGKDFSNMKLYLYDKTGAVIYTIDNSADNTKRTKYVFAAVPQTFIGYKIEFHTSDEVGISFNYIHKSTDVIARIQAIDDSTGLLTDVKIDNGEFIIGGKIGLKNIANNNINPATEDKQDDIIGNQLPDNHQVTVSNPTADPETGLAKEAKQDDIITAVGDLVGFEISAYDYYAMTYVATGSNGAGKIETIVYKTGGSSGTTVATLTMTYDSNDRLISTTKS